MCIHTYMREYSPRDSQDDKILPEHFEINPKIEYPFRNKRKIALELCESCNHLKEGITNACILYVVKVCGLEY